MNQQTHANTKLQKSILVAPPEKVERVYIDMEAEADFAARAVSHDVVEEWLLSLAQGYRRPEHDLHRLYPEA